VWRQCTPSELPSVNPLHATFPSAKHIHIQYTQTHRHTYRVTCFQSREGETRIHIYTHTNHTAEGTTEGEQFVTARVRTARAQVVLTWS
jgi:hypothetical protein